ncbi:RHS repeat protein, partial [Mucilaginibacter sp. HC2]|nr:RHS repeat protein [Mucilaginibacter inviolabilis]
GITSITDTKGETTTYEYDSFQRLMNVKDKDGNIVKHMDYHYQGQ